MPNMGSQSWHRGVPQFPKDVNRLIGSWYPTGKVLWQDDMEDLIANATNHYVNDVGTMAKANDRAFSKQYSLKLTTGGVAGDRADASHYTGLTKYLGKVGFEVKFTSNGGIANLRSLKIGMTYYNNLIHTAGTFWYYGTTQNWRYLNSAGGITTLFAQKLRVPAGDEQAWNGAKLILDFENNRYYSFVCNEMYQYIASIPLRVMATAVTETLLGMYLEVTTDQAVAIDAWIDDVILTEED